METRKQTAFACGALAALVGSVAVACDDEAPMCADGEVSFVDPGLEAAVRSALGAQDGPICAEDAASLEVLEAPHLEIASIEGIQALESLTELNLSGNERLADLAPLKALPSLRTLYLYRALLASGASIEPFGALTSLEHLELGYNGLVDIAPLGGLASLVSLGLSFNEIDDFSPLAQLASLEALYAEDCGLDDLAPLEGLTSLRFLDLAYNGIDDLVPIEGLASVEELYLQETGVADLAPLAGLSALSWLDVRSNQITDLAPLVANEGLGPGDVVWADDNPIDEEDQADEIAALCDRGVELEPYCY